MPSNQEQNSLRQEIAALREEVATLREEVATLRRNQEQGSANSTAQQTTIRSGDKDMAKGSRRFRQKAAITLRHPYYLLLALVAASGLAYGSDYAWNYFQSYESSSDSEISGSISPITSQIEGTVTKVLAWNDEHVNAGQPLIELDQQAYRLAVTIARAKYDAARAQAEIARHNYDALVKNQDPAKPKALAKAAEAAPESAFVTKQVMGMRFAAEDAAEAALDEAQLKLHYTTLTAPVSGTIAEASVNIGQDVQPSQRLMALVQDSPVWVTARFKETQLLRLHRGQAATIYVDALDRNYDGYIASIAPATESEFSLLPPENATGNYVKVVQRVTIRINFKPKQNLARLKPGMSVESTVWLDRG